MVRPSDSSTVSVSSATVTDDAETGRRSVVEILIPLVQQVMLAPIDDSLDLVQLPSGESRAVRHANRIEPELRLARVAFHMDVWRLASVARVKEEPIRPVSENGRHHSRILL